MNFFLNLSYIFMVLSALTGIIRNRHFELKALKLYPLFILIQFINQGSAFLYASHIGHGNNLFLFNAYMPFDVICITAFFYGISQTKGKKRVYAVLTVLWLLFYIINVSFIQGFTKYLSYNRTLEGILFVIYSLMYFHELLKLQVVQERNLFRDATFWIVTALFFFYISSTILMSIWNYLVVYDINLGLLLPIFSSMLYGMYFIGFLLHNPISKKRQT